MNVVPFEIAKKLKEKGFRERTFGFYLLPIKLPQYPRTNIIQNHNKEDDFYSAPTISQVLKWLREEKEIDIVVYPIDGNTVFMGGEKYILSVYINKKRDYKLHHNNIDKYVKWELAALAGIEYIIDNNLI